MASITKGTDSTLLRSELEAQVLESFFLLEEKEKEQQLNNVTINTNFNAKTANVTFNFTIIPQIAEDGTIQLIASNYLDLDDFNPGDGSTLKGANLIQYIFEALTKIRVLEANPANNPTGANRLNATYNYSTGQFSGSVDFTLMVLRDDKGAIRIIAEEYLTN